MKLKKLAEWLFDASYCTAPNLLLQFVDFSTITISEPFEITNVDLFRFEDREVRDYYFKILNDKICCIAQLTNEHKLKLDRKNSEYY